MIPSWLKSIGNFFGGGLAAIWHTILSVINTVYADLHGENQDLTIFVNAIYAGLLRVGLAWGEFASTDYPAFVKWTRDRTASIVTLVGNDYNRLAALINADRAKQTQSVTVIQGTVSSGLASLLQWVISHVLAPLTGDIAGILAWIAKEGAYVVDLLTNLDKLADLIMGFLWKGWIALFRKFAPQIVAYVLANWRAIMPDIASVLEDIITTIL